MAQLALQQMPLSGVCEPTIHLISDLSRRHIRRHTRRCSHNRCRPRFALKPCSLNRDSQQQATYCMLTQLYYTSSRSYIGNAQVLRVLILPIIYNNSDDEMCDYISSNRVH